MPTQPSAIRAASSGAARRRAAACVLVGAAGLVAACRADDRRAADSAAAAVDTTILEPVSTAPVEPGVLAPANAALATYLEASREGSPNRRALDTLTACGSAAGVEEPAGPMLAAFEVLAPAVRGTTVIGRARVVTVAEQGVDRRHPGYYVARQRVRSDTLEWDLVRTPSGRWRVCNGLSFGFAGADSLTAWRPDGASRATARALADSIASTHRQ